MLLAASVQFLLLGGYCFLALHIAIRTIRSLLSASDRERERAFGRRSPISRAFHCLVREGSEREKGTGKFPISSHSRWPNPKLEGHARPY